MQAELKNELEAYLMNWKSIQDCARLFAAIDWSDRNLTDTDKEALGLLELLSTEVLEGMRSEDDFVNEVTKIVSSLTNDIYIRPIPYNGLTVISSVANESNLNFGGNTIGLGAVGSRS